MDTPLHPALILGFVALSLVLTLWLFLQLQIEARRTRTRWQRHGKALEASQRELQRTVDRLQASLAPRPETATLTPELRSLALHMARTGETSGRIAAALALPVNEIELLLKLASPPRAAAAGQNRY